MKYYKSIIIIFKLIKDNKIKKKKENINKFSI